MIFDHVCIVAAVDAACSVRDYLPLGIVCLIDQRSCIVCACSIVLAVYALCARPSHCASLGCHLVVVSSLNRTVGSRSTMNATSQRKRFLMGLCLHSSLA